MVGVTINENESIDKALRRFKKKFERTGVIKEYKARAAFIKPSVKKRAEQIRATRRAHRARLEEEAQ
ncbi:MAG: 30S ribosomal protein S21 [Bacteroidota bacterium]